MKLVKFLFLLLIPMAVHAADDTFKPGKEYQRVQAQTQVASNQVTEFFSYGCHYCYQLEPALEAWVANKGKRIQFSRIPVVFNPSWKNYAKAYYTVKALGLSPKLTPNLFKAIQKQNQNLSTDKAMIDFFVKNGVDEATAKSAFSSSPTMDRLLKNGMQQMQTYKISGVPAIVVGGKYKTDLAMAKTPERLFKILDYLLSKDKRKD